MTSTQVLRRHVRYLCSAVAEISITTGASAGASHVALVTDICVNGMRVSMDGLVAVDSEVVIKVPGNIELVGTVRYLRQDGGEYTMGIGFTVGKWNEQSEWPQHRSLPEQNQRTCEGCVDYASHAPSRPVPRGTVS